MLYSAVSLLSAVTQTAFNVKLKVLVCRWLSIIFGQKELPVSESYRFVNVATLERLQERCESPL